MSATRSPVELLLGLRDDAVQTVQFEERGEIGTRLVVHLQRSQSREVIDCRLDLIVTERR